MQWELPDQCHPSSSEPSREAIQALQFAQAAARDFDHAFVLRNADRERAIPTFAGDELVIGPEQLRLGSYTAEHELRAIRITMDLQKGQFGPASQARSRFAERSSERHFCVKYLQPGIIDSDHSCNAATEMILETKVLMNLAPHPNISQCYGINGDGIDSFLVQGRKGFFIITDRIFESLADRIRSWRDQEDKERNLNVSNSGSSESSTGMTSSTVRSRLNSRLEIAMDVASAIVYLHSRKLVYYLRPDKVGFDTRYERIKLCQFGQVRQEGMISHARSITKSDDMDTLAYTAPEVLCKGRTSTATDVYAFGMIVWELMSLERPFSGWTRAMHFQRVVREHDRPKMPFRKCVGSCWPKTVCELVHSCWDPYQRPDMKTVQENLEVATLFEENEDGKAKEEFRVTRRLSTSHYSGDAEELTRGVERSRSIPESDAHEQKVSRRKSISEDSYSEDFPNDSIAPDTKNAAENALRIAYQEEANLWKSKTPAVVNSQYPLASSQARPKTPSERNAKKSLSARKSPSSDDDPPSGSGRRKTSKRISGVKLSEEAASALNTLFGSPESGSRRIPVKASSGSSDDPDMKPLVLAKLGLLVDNDGNVRGDASAPPPPPSGSVKTPGKTPERRRRKSLDEQITSASPSIGVKTPQQTRRGSVDGGNSYQTPKPKNGNAPSNLQTPTSARSGTSKNRESSGSGSETSPSKSSQRRVSNRSGTNERRNSSGDSVKRTKPRRDSRDSSKDAKKSFTPDELSPSNLSADDFDKLFSDSVIASLVGNVKISTNKASREEDHEFWDSD